MPTRASTATSIRTEATILCLLLIASSAHSSTCDGARSKAERGNKRIVGGRDASLKHWPGQVALRYHNLNKNQSFYFCGGTLVTSRWMITAAHCVFDIAQQVAPYQKRLDAIPGIFMSGKSNAEVISGVEVLDEIAPENVFSIDKIITNKHYDPVTRENDIALIRLSSSAEGPYATLPGSTEDEPMDPPGAMLMSAGFGDLEIGAALTKIRLNGGGFAKAGSKNLQEALLPLVSTSRCAQRFPGKHINASHLCAGYRAGIEDTCQGDSGGPLVSFDANGCPYQIGIVSWGVGCGSTNSYGVYARVSRYIPWIQEQIASEGLLKLVESNQVVDWAGALHRLESIKSGLAAVEELLTPEVKPVSLNMTRIGTMENIPLSDLIKGEKYHLEVTAPVSGVPVVLNIDDIDGTVTQLYPNAKMAYSGGELLTEHEPHMLVNFSDSQQRPMIISAAESLQSRVVTLVLPANFDRSLVFGDSTESGVAGNPGGDLGATFLYDLADQIRAVITDGSAEVSEFGYSVHHLFIR